MLTLPFHNSIAQSSNVLFYDNFDDENYKTGELNYLSLNNWNIVDGSIDLIGNGFFDFFSNHGLYLDMDGSTDKAGTIETKNTFNLLPGKILLQFDLAGSQRQENPKNGPDTVLVKLGDIYSEKFTMGSRVPFQSIERTIPITQPTSAKLSFSQSGNDQVGLLLDNVKLTYLP
jgi:hypothetical protein